MNCGLFQTCPTHDYLSVKVDESYVSVRRTGFLLSPADTMTVYAAHGGTYDAVVVDTKRPPNLDLTKHWLACYVMMPRYLSLVGLLMFRPATRKEFDARPPPYLIGEIDVTKDG